MTDNFGGVRNFYLTNGKPGRLADISTPPNAEGFRIAMGQLGEVLRAIGEHKAPAEDLTPEGIQFVIPGAERMQPAGMVQLNLF